jgi:hypothetical protein
LINARTKLFPVLALAAALVASAATPSFAFLDKTRFVAHLGVAYFCFHHWVLQPYESGAMASGAPHRISTIVKGGVALLFAVHEVKVAQKIAVESKDPLLQKMDAGLVALTASFATLGQKFKSGNFSPQDVNTLKSATSDVSTQAAADGATIKDVPVPAVAGT